MYEILYLVKKLIDIFLDQIKRKFHQIYFSMPKIHLPHLRNSIMLNTNATMCTRVQK
jgi:hypothetical protein